MVFDNNSHESTSDQPINSISVNFLKITLACSYKSAILIKNKIKVN